MLALSPKKPFLEDDPDPDGPICCWNRCIGVAASLSPTIKAERRLKAARALARFQSGPNGAELQRVRAA